MKALLVVGCLVLAGCGPTAEDKKQAAEMQNAVALCQRAVEMPYIHSVDILGRQPDMLRVTYKDRGGSLRFCKVTAGVVSF